MSMLDREDSGPTYAELEEAITRLRAEVETHRDALREEVAEVTRLEREGDALRAEVERKDAALRVALPILDETYRWHMRFLPPPPEKDTQP